MSIGPIKFKIRCSLGTLFLNYSDIFKPRTISTLCINNAAAPVLKLEIYYMAFVYTWPRHLNDPYSFV